MVRKHKWNLLNIFQCSCLFPGINRIQLDFEFIVGRRLTKTWYVLWWIGPLTLLAFFIWALVTLPLNGTLKDDPAWLYGIGWAIILMAFIFILVVGFYTVFKQEEYFTFFDVSATIKLYIIAYNLVSPMQLLSLLQDMLYAKFFNFTVCTLV